MIVAVDVAARGADFEAGPMQPLFDIAALRPAITLFDVAADAGFSSTRS